jgi:hypothetical protein
MEIIRNADGTLVVAAKHPRAHPTQDGDESILSVDEDGGGAPTDSLPGTRLLHPGEGGYDEALAEWDLQQNPEREPVVSTARGRQEAMTLVHEVATSPEHSVANALQSIDDPTATGEALRHVLVGGVHSVEDFSSEVAQAEGGDAMSAHDTTKIIGEILAELD